MKRNNGQIKHTLIALLVLAALPWSAFASDEVIREFTGVSAGDQTILEWTLAPNVAVSLFHVQRSFDGRRFYTIADVLPQPGVTKYRYLDNDLFKNELHTYYYRIETVSPGGGTSLSSTIEVTLSFSGIKRTWGSIKAMFR